MRKVLVRSRRVVLASFAAAGLGVILAANGAFCLTSQDLPAEDMPTNNATPGIAPAPSPSSVPSPAAPEAVPTQVDITPEPSPATPNHSSSENYPGNDSGTADLDTDEETKTSESGSDAEPSPPPPALDAGAVTIGPELGDKTLDPEINKAVAPALAASLRLTESARKRLGEGHFDDAARDLARAVSLDPSDAFAYYYLGRAYLTKGNYTQALTFFRRAEIGFNGRPEWTAEALSYEGICDEELAKPTDAAEAYKRALAASPNNFRARVGYGRLASMTGPEENVDAAPPTQDLAIPPPSAPDESAPPTQPPPPPPE